MNAFDMIHSRRSTRNYNGNAITEEELSAILKAGYAAPVGRALYHTLTMTVIENPDYLARWEKATGEANGNPDAHPFYGAPTVILVSSAMPVLPKGDDTYLRAVNVNFSNAAIVVENMSLAATALGVGSCLIWGAVRTLNITEDLLSELALPEGMVPCCALAVGHTDEAFPVRQMNGKKIRTTYFK